MGSAGIIINGEPGSGKTHLIGRLRKRLTDDLAHPTLERPRQAFAYVRLDTNASSLARHVRRKVADDLLRKIGGPNQFERLVLTRMMEVDNGDGHLALWWEYFRDERLDDSRELLTELCQQEGLSPAFVQVLNHMVARRHRLDVMGWLRGDSLTPAAFERLGIAAEETEDHPERVAERFLVDLMKLAGSKMPLVLCFDQVEALQTSADDVESIFAFGQLVSLLHAADQNLVIISCMQLSLFEQMRESLPNYLLDRVSGFGTETLNPLTEDLAELLVSHRLQAVNIGAIRPIKMPAIWPFTDHDLKNFVGKTGTTPRRLLDQAARKFDEFAGRRIAQIELSTKERTSQGMSDEWERRLEVSNNDSSPKRSVEILRAGLQHLVHVTNSDWTLQPDPGDVLDFILIAPQNEARVGVKVCDDSPNRLASQVRRLSQLFPKSLNVQKLVLLKDDRSPISRNAAATQKYLKELEVNDAIYHKVAPEAIAALDALRQLLADVKSGDLAFDGQNVEVRTVMDWLRSHLPESLTDLAEVMTLPSAGGGFDEPSLIEKLQELLNDRPICRVEEASQQLNTSTSQLIAAASERLDLFRVLDGKQPVVFSVRTSGVCFDESIR